MRYPFDKYVLGTKFGFKGSLWAAGYHSGQDFKSANYGGDGKIYPLYAGKVQKVTTTGSYGNCVYVEHADGYITLYAHMKTVYVKAGQDVGESTVLGIEGTTGNSTGIHCHVEVHKGAYKYPATIDPIQFIQERLEDEMEKEIVIKLNGKQKNVTAIEKNGNNYVKLQDLADQSILIDYDGLPVVSVKTNVQEIRLNGVKKSVNVICKDNYNYVKLQDLRDDKIEIGYDGVPKVDVVK